MAGLECMFGKLGIDMVSLGVVSSGSVNNTTKTAIIYLSFPHGLLKPTCAPKSEINKKRSIIFFCSVRVFIPTDD